MAPTQRSRDAEVHRLLRGGHLASELSTYRVSPSCLWPPSRPPVSSRPVTLHLAVRGVKRCCSLFSAIRRVLCYRKHVTYRRARASRAGCPVGVAVGEMLCLCPWAGPRKPGLPVPLNTTVLPLGFCPPPCTVRGESLPDPSSKPDLTLCVSSHFSAEGASKSPPRRLRRSRLHVG